MNNMTIEETENRKILHVEGDLSYDEAARLKTFLSEALETADDIELNLEKMSSIDLKSMQLIYLAKRFARNATRNIVFKVRFSESFRKALENAATGQNLIRFH